VCFKYNTCLCLKSDMPLPLATTATASQGSLTTKFHPGLGKISSKSVSGLLISLFFLSPRLIHGQLQIRRGMDARP
jgi:hypothetical protein